MARMWICVFFIQYSDDFDVFGRRTCELIIRARRRPSIGLANRFGYLYACWAVIVRGHFSATRF